MMKKTTLVVAAAAIGVAALHWAPTAALAEVELPSVFGDHMVLQQDAVIRVWGTADPGEPVRVDFRRRTSPSGGKGTAVATTADQHGRWMVALGEHRGPGKCQLTVTGKENSVEISDILLGEVWLCSGQSNMAWTVSRSANFEEEREAADYPKIRMFTASRTPATEPQDDVEGSWAVCSPETVGNFSAAGYFFARKLHQELDVPVGMLHSSWGGTPIQAWTSLPAQEQQEPLQPMLREWEQRVGAYDHEKAKAAYEKALAAWEQRAKEAKESGTKPPQRPRPAADPRLNPHRPANLYNGMIAPLAPFTLRGAIWYQGESNAGRYNAGLYGLQLETLIEDWREAFDNPDMPLIWVQLPNFHAPQKEPVETSGWVIVQEQMLRTLAVPHTGMAITIDVGEANDIHPKNKQDVGKRLALWALGTTYGKDIVYSGPIYKSHEKRDGKIVLRFEHTGEGLQAKGDRLEGFAIAGPDKQFVWAEAKIEGDQVIVDSDEVTDPQAVRYCWASNPRGNLYNSADLPASPFRTDDWGL